jgi:hypothetical protein
MRIILLKNLASHHKLQELQAQKKLPELTNSFFSIVKLSIKHSACNGRML